jgi:UDP-2,3-diacylglucosamine pyrophosphatase LpxH
MPSADADTKTSPALGQRYRFRTLFLSDIHLGSRNCKAKMLRELLNNIDAEQIYLVGDIIDGERLKHRHYWPQEHEEVLQLLAEKAASGTRVTYIAGNHDEGLRDWMHSHGIERNNHADCLSYRNFQFKQRDIHVGADGVRSTIIHGDQFDGLMQKGHALDWLLPVGDALYDLLAFANRHLNDLREALGMPYWSLAGAVKSMVKVTAGKFNHTQDKLLGLMHEQGTTRALFGHTHMPKHLTLGNCDIYNDGDMVDSITAIVEPANGGFHLLEWAPLYNGWKKAKAAEVNPAVAFSALAMQYGAQIISASPHHDFSQIARTPGNVPSRFAEIIELATHGPRPAAAKWPFPVAEQRLPRP